MGKRMQTLISSPVSSESFRCIWGTRSGDLGAGSFWKMGTMDIFVLIVLWLDNSSKELSLVLTACQYSLSSSSYFWYFWGGMETYFWLQGLLMRTWVLTTWNLSLEFVYSWWNFPVIDIHIRLEFQEFSKGCSHVFWRILWTSNGSHKRRLFINWMWRGTWFKGGKKIPPQAFPEVNYEKRALGWKTALTEVYYWTKTVEFLSSPWNVLGSLKRVIFCLALKNS